jgi:hypothetical protein
MTTTTIVRAGVTSLAAAATAAAAFALAAPAAHATGYRADAAPACGNTSLAVTHSPSDSGAGHGGFVLLFRNRTSHACTLHGYPGLDALSGSGHVLKHAKRTRSGYLGGGKVRTVRIKPGHFASATVEWLNFNPKTSGSCRFSKKIATTPANTSDTVTLSGSVSVCDLQVHPTVIGTTGNKHFAYAQADWIRGARAIAAEQGKYWSRAKADLHKDGDEYSTEVKELRQLIALPDANETPAQQHRARHDVRELNAFFSTPGLYS